MLPSTVLEVATVIDCVGLEKTILPGPVRLRPSTTLVLLAENVGGVRAYHTSDSEAIVVVGF